MWPDNETATDLLGFDVHANLLRAVITDDSMLPLIDRRLRRLGRWKDEHHEDAGDEPRPEHIRRGLCPALSMQLNRHCIREHVAVRGV